MENGAQATMASATDPVCGMEVAPDKAYASHTFDGVTYPFCSKSCLEQFQAESRRYVKDKGGAGAG